MSDQAHHWSEVAKSYEQEFIDPYRPDVRNPLLKTLGRLRGRTRKVVADLGCGIGPLLPVLAEQFSKVYAIDFAAGMLERARERCRGLANIEFVQRSFMDLSPLAGEVDVAVAVNSLVLPNIADLEGSLRQIHALLRPGGIFLGIVPAMDAVYYYTMLLVDRALAAGKPPAAARQSAAHWNEHGLYDFAFGVYRIGEIEQHFWQPFEVRYRLRRAGFGRIRLARVLLAWDQFACAEDLAHHPPPWDWFFRATKDKPRES